MLYTQKHTYSASSKTMSPNNLAQPATLANDVQEVTDLNHGRKIGYSD
jgi:hypothetical protein